MIKMAAAEASSSKHTNTSRDNDIRYVWTPEVSQAQPMTKHSNPNEEEFEFSFQKKMENDDLQGIIQSWV